MMGSPVVAAGFAIAAAVGEAEIRDGRSVKVIVRSRSDSGRFEIER